MSGLHVVIACGGTGGHLSPGIALAEALVATGHRATLLISHKKVDTRLVEKYPHLRFLRVPGVGLTATPAGVARFVVSQVRGLLFSLTLVARERPQAVVGFGGFTTSTIILAAALRRIPIFLHEANRVPGKAIRTLQVLAQRIYLPPGVTLRGTARERQAALALPVRAEIRRLPREEARARWRLRSDRPVVAVLGGSQGASALNDWATRSTPDLVAAGVQLVCVTGLGKGEDKLTEHPSPFGPITVATVAFCDQMAALFSAADLVVTRAGAGTLAEMARCLTPGVLIPFPFAADQHQDANAAYFADEGGGVVIPQTEMERVLPLVLALLPDAERLNAMQMALRRLSAAHRVEPMIKDLQRTWEFGT